MRSSIASSKQWGAKYPLIIRSWRSNWNELATFFKYPPELPKLIYTTNMIEIYHRQLRKVTKEKSIFQAMEGLLKMLYLVTMDVTRMDRPHPELGTNASPTHRILSGADRAISALRVDLPLGGDSLHSSLHKIFDSPLLTANWQFTTEDSRNYTL